MDEKTKPCPVCGESIKVAALKCRFCNTDLVAFAAAKEFAIERTLFVGHPAVVYSVNQFLPFLAVLVAAIAVGYFRAALDVNIWYVISGFVVACGIVSLRFYIRSWSRHFEITTQRIKLERGLFSKVKESLELFRIDHFELREPLGMRLMGQAALHLFSSDAELCNFYVYGVPNLELLADELRTCQLRERTRRGLSTVVRA